MRSLVLLLATLGLTVGLLPLVIELVHQNFFESEVVYNGVYEPLRGVEMSRSYEAATNLSFDVRSELYLRWWIKWMPLIGALVGALLGFVLHRLGFRLSRHR